MLLNGLPQQIANGVILGAVYALFAVGYAIVFAALDTLNLVHAAIALAAALAAWWLLAVTRLPLLAVLPLAALLAGCLGLAVNRLAFAQLRRRSAVSLRPLIAGLALATVLQGLATGAFGNAVHPYPSTPLLSGVLPSTLGGLGRLQLLVLLLAVVLLALLRRLMLTTRYGRAVRAIAENPHSAKLLGLDVERVIDITFFLAAAMGGIAGVLYGLTVQGPAVDLSEPLQLRGLAIILLGGLGSIPGAIIGGFTLALLELLSGGFLAAPYRDGLAFLVLFLVVLLRPTGLLGRHAVREV
ncbi:MAG TPA: branched-chain amino acid ABC transporter permease [Chloroflexota bacterium]|jgi:branched-chain amino acid transport system permease protein|nr:branched-chain amino acid ABC transporter permease [Chloroflexota bacterium]